MASLNPGQVSQSLRAERIRLELKGAGAASTEFFIDGDDALRLDSPLAGRWVVESTGEGRAVLGLAARGEPSAQMGGEVVLTLKAVPVNAEGEPLVASSTLEVMGLVVEGRSRVDVVGIARDRDQFWSFTSLLPQQPRKGHEQAPQPGTLVSGNPVGITALPGPSQPASVDPLRRALQHIWNDLPRVSRDILVAVDRSASMSWAFRPGGPLAEVEAGVNAVAEVCSAPDARWEWASFGSAADQSDRVTWRSRDSGRSVVEELRPAHFSSGSDPHVAVSEAVRYRFAEVLIVGDRMSDTMLGMASEPGVSVAVLLLGASDFEEDWPQQDRDLRDALNAQGIEVMGLSGTGDRGMTAMATARLLASRLERQVRETGGTS